MERIDKGTYQLPSGRVFDANADIIGINTLTLEPHEGYDGQVHVHADGFGGRVAWTEAERRELADFMIERWTMFRDYPPAACSHGVLLNEICEKCDE